jgi:hypothetical protein
MLQQVSFQIASKFRGHHLGFLQQYGNNLGTQSRTKHAYADTSLLPALYCSMALQLFGETSILLL